ncbi:MAG: Ca2+-binding EF-hand superfamily protein [Pirellulaceae bacterium]|jgi:Ca2+-binding EF-hand superfamily protein
MDHGPVVVDLKIKIGNATLQQAFGNLIDDVLAHSDANGDGESSWEELSRMPRYVYGIAGNAPFRNEQERRNMIELYDVNKNSIVDRDEVPRFLTRNAGGAKAFSLSDSNYFRYYNRRDSGIRRALDVDRNGAISFAELAELQSILTLKDLDQDELLLPNELIETTETSLAQLPNVRRPGPSVGNHLAPSTNWTTLLYSLQEHYAYGDKIEGSSVLWLPGVFDKLDENADGKLSIKEISRIETVPAHVTITLQFPGGDSDAELSILDVETHQAVELGGEMTLEAQRVVLPFSKHETLELFINDLAMSVNAAQAEQRFNAIDADGNKYVDEAELTANGLAQAGQFSVADADGDEKVTLEELREYLQMQQLAIRSQVRGRISDTPDALFTYLDADRDGRLETRELASAAERMKALDENGDQKINMDEIPGSMYLGISRGDPQNMNAMFSIPSANIVPNEEQPAWFEKMDRNGDGDLSRREFLGTEVQFGQLDTDDDGFISVQEVLSIAETNSSEDTNPSEEVAPAKKLPPRKMIRM